jgi:hypothetical protein
MLHIEAVADMILFLPDIMYFYVTFNNVVFLCIFIFFNCKGGCSAVSLKRISSIYMGKKKLRKNNKD